MVKVIVGGLGEFVIAGQLPQSVAFDGGVKHRFVVATQQHGASGVGQIQKATHRNPRVWSSVDHVAETHKLGV